MNPPKDPFDVPFEEMPLAVKTSGVPNGCKHQNHGYLRKPRSKKQWYGCVDCRTLAHGYECKCEGCAIGNHIRR